MEGLKRFNHWLGGDKVLVFAPRVVSDIKSGQQKNHINASSGSSACTNSGCSGPGSAIT